MPQGQWNLEFLNHNAQRAYPLTADSTRQDVSGSFEIPNDFLVGADIAMPITSGVNSSRFLIYQIGVYSSGVHLIIGHDEAGTITPVANVSIPRTAAKDTAYVIGGTAGFETITGKVVVGKLTTLYEQPSGLYTFDLTGSRFEPQVVRPMIRGVAAFRVSNAAGSTSRDLTGIIELVAGTNIQLSTAVAGNTSKIVISALDGSGTIEECSCEGAAAEIPAIKTINGIPPDAQGNFNLVGDDCITVTAIPGGIQLTDSCSKPCCGCAELEAITRDLETFNSQRVTYQTFVDQLAGEVGRMRTSTLGSRLGDRRCLTCE
jgi:hypothetical protein